MKIPTTSELGACREPVPLADAMRLLRGEAERIEAVQADLVTKGLLEKPLGARLARAAACRRAYEIMGSVLPYAEDIGETISKLRRFERRQLHMPTPEEIENATGEMTLRHVVYYLGVCAAETEGNEEALVTGGFQAAPSAASRSLIAALDAARDIVEVVATYPQQIGDKLRQLRQRGPRR